MADLVLGVGTLAVLVAFMGVGSAISRRRVVRRRHSTLAALDRAGMDDPRFESQEILADIGKVLRHADWSLDHRDPGPMQQLFGDTVFARETTGAGRSKASLDGVEAKRTRGWAVDLVGFNNSGRQAARVVARIGTRLAIWPSSGRGFWRELLLAPGSFLVTPSRLRVASRRRFTFLTLEHRAEGWSVVAGEYGVTGMHQLAAPIVAEPSESKGFHDASVRELLETPAHLAPPVSTEDTPYNNARQGLLDLAVVDERFDLGVIEAVIRDLVAGVSRRRTGRDEHLERITTGLAFEQLQTEGGLGSPRLVSWQPQRLIESDPPELFVEVHIDAGTRKRWTSAWQLGLQRVQRPYSRVWKLRFAPDIPERWILASAHARHELRTGHSPEYLDEALYEPPPGG